MNKEFPSLEELSKKTGESKVLPKSEAMATTEAEENAGKMPKKMFQHIKSEEVKKLELGAINVENISEMSNVSIARVEIVGEQKFGLNLESDVTYYVVKGKGEFFVESASFAVKEGDTIFIPRNTKYKDSGQLTLLAIASPRFDGNKHVLCED